MKKLILLTVVIMNICVFSQENIYTLSNAIDDAIRNNLDYSVATYSITEKQKDIESAMKQLSPSIDTSLVYNRTDEPGAAAFSKIAQGGFNNTYMTQMANPDEVENNLFEASINIPIFMGGTVRNSIKYYSEIKKSKEYDVERYKENLIFDVFRTYHSIIMAHAVTVLARQSVESASEHVKQTKNMLEAGIVMNSDLLKTQVFLHKQEQFLINAENNLKIAKMNLGYLTGNYTKNDFEIDKSISILECEHVDIEYLINSALKNRKELMSIQQNIKALSYYKRSVEGKNKPMVYGFSKYSQNSEDIFEDEGKGNTSGIMFEYKLVDFGKTKKESEKIDINIKKLKKMKEALKQKIILEVNTDLLNMEAASKSIQVAISSVEKAKEMQRVVVDQYNQGLTTIVNLTDTETAYKEANMNYIKSVYEFNVAREKLKLSASILNCDSLNNNKDLGGK
ncbi:MAG: hypothetical protein C0601_02570 [Candidatus Muiribacterium halophilum]|uniref:TolC family protein n=1 Tax=Muiribacterium halophilum TaxID=2053465 RepID=A0A2N5ZKM7_MUIH1|nr:MAG: hypothetical protein C0601_02570 [Candidatus Muirbacterium halophilum]